MFPDRKGSPTVGLLDEEAVWNTRGTFSKILFLFHKHRSSLYSQTVEV